MKKNASRLRLNAFFFIYYDQVLNNLYVYLLCLNQKDRVHVSHDSRMSCELWSLDDLFTTVYLL
jgi:hypothetical protein